MRCSSLNTTRPVRPSTSRYLYAPQATTLPHSTPPPVFIFHNFYFLSQISTEYLQYPWVVLPLNTPISLGTMCISWYPGIHRYFLLPYTRLGVFQVPFSYLLSQISIQYLQYPWVVIPLSIPVSLCTMCICGCLRYFLLSYTRLGIFQVTFRYLLSQSSTEYLQYPWVLPLSTPVSLGTMCISWCPGYSQVLLVALHTPWCVTSQYPCTPVSLTHALVLLGTFGAPRYVMVFVGISVTLWVSCVSLIVFLYSWESFWCFKYLWEPLGSSRYLQEILATSRYHLVRPCTYLISWYIFLLLGTYSVPTRYLLGTSSVPTRYLSVSLGNYRYLLWQSIF